MPARATPRPGRRLTPRPSAEIGAISPVALGERQERVRAHEAALGVVPADQRLDADHAALVERHERLVVQHELLALERSAQAGDHRKLVGGVAARRDRQPVARGSASLAAVHGDVGVLQELLGACRRRRERLAPMLGMM